MTAKHTYDPQLLLFILLLSIASSFNVWLATAEAGGRQVAGDSPFTAKASLIRYWRKQVSNSNLPKPFFLSKASPLDAVQLATYGKLADQNSLSTQLPTFCKAANLLCFPDVAASLEKHTKDVNFAKYQLQNFTNYGSDRLGGADSFKNYTNGIYQNLVDTFRRYSRDSVRHDDQFTNYAIDANVVDQNFNTYGTNTTGGAGDFRNYNSGANVPGLTFTSYSEKTNGRSQDFKKYSEHANGGNETFTSYGKDGDGASNDFTSYGNRSNLVGSTFNNYGENGNRATDNFTSYGERSTLPQNTFKSYSVGGNGVTETFSSYGSHGNTPTNNFRSYGSKGNAITQSFANYGDDSTVADDSFQSYADGENAATLDFTTYGLQTVVPNDTFKGYATDSNAPTVGFQKYGFNTAFKVYAETGVTFASYFNESGSAATGKKLNRRWVEPGKFFREEKLKTGTVLPMPDIRDKMPKRSFLPRTILSKLPFSTSKIHELKKIFHAADDSSMAKMMGDALSECERAPSPGETKRCVGSGEDMIDFATSVLRQKVTVRSTDNTLGSGGDIKIGTVKGINGGQVTKSVSCHQSLYPYLLYYCHSVPEVRVYEVDILDLKSNAKINHGVAICHVDTSTWSQSHGAFIALGSGPGKIEVCHWIFENDMTWTIAD